jgi:hypothetical protein
VKALMKPSFDNIGEKLTNQRSLLDRIVHGNHQFPRLMVIFPVMARGWSRLNPLLMLTNRSRLFFICSYTKQLAVCGPEGRGYEIEVTRPEVGQAIKQTLPFLQLSLATLSMSMKLLSSPDVSMISDLLNGNSIQDLLDASATSLDLLSGLGSGLPEVSRSAGMFRAVGDPDDPGFSPDAVEQAMAQINPRTVCESVKAIVAQVDPTLALAGLILAISPSGGPEWVLNIPEVMNE